MHYINIIDYAHPDDFFMFMSSRIDSLNIQRNNSWTLCKINNKELTIRLLASYLSEYIWENSLPEVCMKLLSDSGELSAALRKDIISRTMNVAFCMKDSCGDVVYEKLAEYLTDEYNFLSVDGFVHFRLKGLLDDLKTLLEISIYENSADEEYNEFILFMKEIVSIQNSLYDEIFLFEEKNGFKILSADGDDITQKHEKTLNPSYCFDSIISTIIYIAPKKIYIHCTDEMFTSDFCEILKGIFSGKVIKC